jgi:LysR family transcriptional activator of glutamate synthase operon
MEFRQIQTFLEIHRQGSFVNAAARLALTQPALSRQISLLERELGAKLFFRSAAGTRLTPEGEKLLGPANDLEHSLRNIEESLKSKESISGRYTISCGGTIAAYVLPQAVRKIRQKHPDLLVRVVEGDAYDTLRSVSGGESELGILSGQPADSELESEFYFRDEIVPVVGLSHPLARRRRMSAASLGDFECVSHHPASAIRQAVEKKWKALRLKPRIVMELRSMESVLRSVEAGVGVGFVSRLSVSKKMRVLPISELVSQRDFYFCFRRRSRGMDQFIDLLRNTGS